MQLDKREFPKILQFYRVDDLNLVFDGFESITPDKALYYWHNPADGSLYAMELADYVHEFMDSEPSSRIVEDFWDDHSCDWEVERWLSHNDSTDYADLDNWFYWPECGDKCVMAQLKADVSVLVNRKLERNIADVNPEQMAARRAKLKELIEIDNQR